MGELLPMHRNGFGATLRRYHGIVALFLAIAAIGWHARDVLAKALGKKADAVMLETAAVELAADHDRLGRLEQRVEDIHEDVAGLRSDFRIFAAGRPLPTLTPEMKK